MERELQVGNMFVKHTVRLLVIFHLNIYNHLKFCLIGESVYSDVVKLKVAKATTNECSFPKFKIALVICEEKYQKTAQFPSLKATRNDGEALIRALQELQFQVLAFTNLTLGQLKNAIDLFASFIDEETYALFYYNGHAVGHNEDIYLATVESSLGKIISHHFYDFPQ